MRQNRYTAPLDLIETETASQRKCPYCRWGSHSLYRLECWPEDEAGCAHCVLDLLSEDDYAIYVTRPGETDTDSKKQRSSTRARTAAPAENEQSAG